jgi:hypothetical protein
MTYTPIARGTLNWDTPLNVALAQLDANTTSVLGSSLQAANNLSDLTNVPVARANLGISSGSTVGGMYYNVKDYGALGNGVQDDTTYIQAAINAATGGGTIFFPPGNYLLNSSQLTMSVVGTNFLGAGPESTKFTIGTSFTGAYAVQITANSCGVANLSFYGNSTTTTSNPIMNAIEVTAVRRAKVMNCIFWYINGWCVEVTAGSGSSNNPEATMISHNIMRSSAGGIHFLGNTASGYAVDSFVDNNEIISMGVTSGANANLDGIKVEDSWDVLIDNNLSWVSVGTGSCLRVHGNCAATFVKNLDTLGPTTGNAVLLEDGTNGSPQNVQINGGVIQQGNIGLSITGGATQCRFTSLRFINNQTHGASVAGTGAVIHFTDVFFSQSGQGATGSNYDINWSGSSNGYISGCRFDSPIVTTGTAGVQQTINFPASAPVRVFNCAFGGTSSTSANWFTNTPLGVLEATSGQFNFATTVKFTNSTAATIMGNLAAQPAASGNTILSSNVNGVDSFDRMRFTGDGTIAIGSGSAARDTFTGRAAANTWYTQNNLLVGSNTALGDNGNGEIQVHNATTVPTTNPTNGALMYATGGVMYSRNAQGLVTTDSGVISSVTSPVTVTTTGAQAFQTVSIPANDPIAGAVYELNGYGSYSTAASSPGTLNITLQWGSTSIAALGTAPSLGTSLSNVAFSYKAQITFRTSTTAYAVLTFTLVTVGAQGTNSTYVTSSGSGPITVTTSSAQTLETLVNFSATGNSITLQAGDARRMA